MPKLALDDVSLHYELSGNGPPLLMIAGMFSDSASWTPLVPLLEPHFTLIRPDNRNTGRTTPLDVHSSFLLLADNCIQLMRHLNYPVFHVLGHSMGGLIGTLLAHYEPKSVTSLTLAANAPVHLTRNVALFKALLAIRYSDAPDGTWLRAPFPWLFAPSRFDDPAAIDEVVAASLTYPFAQTREAMRLQCLAFEAQGAQYSTLTTQAPTLVILAQDDLLLPLNIAQAAHGDTPQAIVQGAGHSIHWDAPQAVAAHIISHINANPITGSNHDT